MSVAVRDKAGSSLCNWVDLRESERRLWDVAEGVPVIRQIYGHFLAPRLVEAVRSGLVAKDFNFPSAYHASTGRSLESVMQEIAALSPLTRLRIGAGVHVRSESCGAVVYTPHYNGYYVNGNGLLILKALQVPSEFARVAASLPVSVEAIKEFVGLLLLVGIAEVEHAPAPV